MSRSAVKLKAPDPAATDQPAGLESVCRGLAGFLPGIRQRTKDPVTLTIPPYQMRADEQNWLDFLADNTADARQKRRDMADHIQALLDLDDRAKHEEISLEQAAQQQVQKCQKTMEIAWTSLLEQNKRKETGVRALSTFFSNLGMSARRWRNKIHVINASAREIASDAGCAFLAKELSRYFHRPDPRKSRAYLVVPGWVGTPAALHKLSRVADAHRCLLITDGPCYDDVEKLRTAASEGGALESLAGEEMHHRHTIVIGNEGRVRARFQGEYASEESDVYIPLSSPWFGMFLDSIAGGRPWDPPLGYSHPIQGVDAVRLDLLLEDKDGFDLYLRHRVNPCILLAEGSNQVVVWGPDTLCKADSGVQIGVAAVEQILIRYTEWIINRYVLLHDLEQSEQVFREKMRKFMVMNSGVDRMFRTGSRVQVSADDETRTVSVNFELLMRLLAEKAEIQLTKPVEPEKLSTVTANYAA